MWISLKIYNHSQEKKMIYMYADKASMIQQNPSLNKWGSVIIQKILVSEPANYASSTL